MRVRTSLTRCLLCASGLLSLGTQVIAGASQDAPDPMTVDDAGGTTTELSAAHRLNCGGGTFVDSDGREWSSDAGYVLPSSAERDPDQKGAYDVPGVTSLDGRLLYVCTRLIILCGLAFHCLCGC